MGTRTRRSLFTSPAQILFTVLLLLGLLVAPSAALAQDEEPEAELLTEAIIGTDEVILINRNDGRIVIQDFMVEPGTVDLTGKYDSFGGPYYDVAAGDFDGDGRREIVAIGGYVVGQPGPVLNTWDPNAVKQGIPPTVPTLTVSASPNVWTHVACGDLDLDGRDEIVAIRTANEGVIQAHVVAFKFDPASGQWQSNPMWDLPTAGGFVDLDLGDINNDGGADVVLTRQGRIVIVIDGRAPTITHFQATIGDLESWTRAKIGNVDGAGNTELVIMRPQPALSGMVPAAVYAIEPTGVSPWKDVGRWGFPTAPADIRLADTNADGVPEIVALTVGSQATLYTLNPRLPADGDRIERRVAVGDNVWAPVLRLGDANADGRPNAMTIEKNGGYLRVWDYHTGGGTLDVVAYGPYWQNFAVANLDGSGVEIRPRLSVADQALLLFDLSASRGTTTAVKVENTGAGSFNWVATYNNCPWLTAFPPVGTPGQSIAFSINSNYLPSTTPGATDICYVGIQATALDGGLVLDNNQVVNVRLRVSAKITHTHLPVAFR